MLEPQTQMETTTRVENDFQQKEVSQDVPETTTKYSKQEIRDLKKAGDVENLRLLQIDSIQPFPQDEVDNYIDSFIVTNGGTLAELFVKLPQDANPQLLEYIKIERQAQVDFTQDYLQLFDINNELFSGLDSDQKMEMRRELINSGFFEYATRFKEVRSLSENIPTQYKQEFQVITTEALRQRDVAQKQLTESLINTINKVHPTEGGGPLNEDLVSATPIDGVLVNQESSPPTITATETGSKQKKEYILTDAILDVLPFLIAMDSTLAFAKGQHPQLATLLRESDEMINGVKTNEQILGTFNIAPNAVELLRKDKVTESFFRLFKGQEQKLIDFFDSMNPYNGNMYLFLEKMSSQDIRVMLEKKILPGEIYLKDEDVLLILGKLRTHERRRLGIHETEAKML